MRVWPSSAGGWVRLVYLAMVAALVVVVATNTSLGFGEMFSGVLTLVPGHNR